MYNVLIIPQRFVCLHIIYFYYANRTELFFNNYRVINYIRGVREEIDLKRGLNYAAPGEVLRIKEKI